MSHGKSHGSFAVMIAIIGNTIITILKFIGFFLTGSGAMFSEAIHSFADTMNQSLLMIGLKKSEKKSDEKFDYGYEKERFFWAILSACGIFFIGAGITIYHGVEAILHPNEVKNSIITYVILIIAGLIEGVALILAIKSIYKKKIGLLKSINLSDPATKAVIFEDGVAVGGIIIALISSILVYITGNVLYDAIASIIIGMLLGGVAIVLVLENKSYLIGKSLPEKIKEGIFAIISEDELILSVIDFKSQVIGLDKYVIKCDAVF